MLWIREVKIVNSVDDPERSFCIEGIIFSWFRVAQREDCIDSEQDHPKFLLLKYSQSGGGKSRKRIGSFAENRSLVWSTIPSQSLLSMNPYSTKPIYLQQFFAMTMFRNSTRGGTKFFLTMTKLPLDDTQERLSDLRTRESDQFKTVVDLYNLEIHQKQAKLDHQRLKTSVKKKHRAEFEITEHWDQKLEKWIRRLDWEPKRTTSRSQRTVRMLAMEK